MTVSMKGSVQRQLIVSFLLLEQNTCQLLNSLLFIVSLTFVSRLCDILLPAFPILVINTY